MFRKDVAYIHSLPSCQEMGISEGGGGGTSCGIILVHRLPLISHSFTNIYDLLLYLYTYRFHRLPIDMMKSFWENPRHFMFRVTRHFFLKKRKKNFAKKLLTHYFIQYHSLLLLKKNVKILLSYQILCKHVPSNDIGKCRFLLS